MRISTCDDQGQGEMEIFEIRFPVNGKITEFSIKEGQVVSKDTIIFQYVEEDVETAEQEAAGAIKNEADSLPRHLVQSSFRVSREGKIVKIVANLNENLRKHDLVCLMTDLCSHAVQLHGLCALCGKDVSEDDTLACVNIIHGSSDLKVTLEEAERIESNSLNNLLKNRKLSLVIDLDQTILHCSIDPIIEEWINDPSHVNHEAVKNVEKFFLSDSPVLYFLKLRRNLQQFLSEISKLYELHIYTMGTRNYANAVVQIIDPNSNLFHDRVLTRDDSGSKKYLEFSDVTKKELSRIFPCGDSMVVVIDDRSDIWKWSQNLVQVRPCNQFVNEDDFFMSGDINDPEKLKDTLEGGIEKHTNAILVDNDNELEIIGKVLKQIHKLFYKAFDKADSSNVDVKVILRKLKEKVLKNVNICFSGIIPLNQEASLSNVWKLACQFGANCSNILSKETTHLIASNTNTVKAKEAYEMGIHVVNSNWLYDSIHLWKRQKENLYYFGETKLSTEELDSMSKEVEAFMKDEDEESSSLKGANISDITVIHETGFLEDSNGLNDEADSQSKKFKSDLFLSTKSDGAVTDDLDISSLNSEDYLSLDDDLLAKQIEEFYE